LEHFSLNRGRLT